MPHERSTVREGLLVGFIGATSVALWFLILNAIQGRDLLYTPTVLGKALFRILGPWGGEPDIVYVIAYTILHYGVFALVGILVTYVVHRAERQPSVLALFLVLFVVMEAGFYGATAILSDRSILGDLAWYQIGVANLLAAVLMGAYLWRHHPELRQEFAQALGDAAE